MLTLLRQDHPLADSQQQRHVLESPDRGVPVFQKALDSQGGEPLRSTGLRILQINLGKLCNQTCSHCHVDAGPDRREIMTRPTIDACLEAIEQAAIETVDLTGGAPEMNPHFRDLVQELRRRGVHVIDRCNLTILLAPGYRDMAEFLASQQVEIIASLPCYLEENCDRQRGNGVFNKSIEALRLLNSFGYGRPESGLSLNLVFNPAGVNLPPSQQVLEDAYREQLRSRFEIEFNHLLTITNMPISRFLTDLLDANQLDPYLEKLHSNLNLASVERLMCRETLSVDWQGNLYDCDFNQMLDLPVLSEKARTIFEFNEQALNGRLIQTGRHCYGCTAGAGSSCHGSLVEAT